MKINRGIQTIAGVAIGATLLGTGTGCRIFNPPPPKIIITVSIRIPGPTSQPAAPTGYSTWSDYCSSQPGMTVSGNDLDIAEGTDVGGTPPPAGYASWDEFNDNPSEAPPSGFATWEDWAYDGLFPT